MRTAIFTILSAGIAIGAVATPAAARDYPYCVQGRELGIPGDCSYQTYAQCQATASGRNAYCNVNPTVAFQQQRPQGPGFRTRGRMGNDGNNERF